MDKKYLEDYQEKENEQYKKYVIKKVKNQKFSTEKDKYPPKERFKNLQEPIAITTFNSQRNGRFWAQVPFCGSLILLIPPISKHQFEKNYLKVEDISELINFVKKTGRIQIALTTPPTQYFGLDYLDPFFKELDPPVLINAPMSLFLSDKEMLHGETAFHTLAKHRYYPLHAKIRKRFSYQTISNKIRREHLIYSFLKKFNPLIAEEIENNMIDNPIKAFALFNVAQKFIVDPYTSLLSNQINLTYEDVSSKDMFQNQIELKEIKFPYEIGSFLMKKMTLAPLNSRACYDVIDHYEKYDLEKVQKSLNDAIIAKNPDLILKSSNDLSEILDNVWADKRIPNTIKVLKHGISLIIGIVGLLIAAKEGLLPGLGLEVGSAVVEALGCGTIEKIVRKGTIPYQANIYDFKKNYNLTRR